MRAHSSKAAGGRRQQRRRLGGWTPSVRTRILTIALIPSVALFITGATITGVLTSEGLAARNYSSYFVRNSSTIVQLIAAEEQERTISLRALGGDQKAIAGLPAQWNATNALLAKTAAVSQTVQGMSVQAASSSGIMFRKMAGGLAAIRQGARSGRASATEVDSFYTQLADVGSTGFAGSALASPSTAAGVDQMIALGLYPVPDLNSRVTGLGAGWATRGRLTLPERLTIGQLAGAYRDQLQRLAPLLPPTEKAAYTRLTTGAAWRTATSGEDDLAENGKLSMSIDSWLAAEKTVFSGLLGLWGGDLNYAQSVAVTAANQSLSRSVTVGSLVLVLTLAALAAAIILANSLVRRLRRLRENTMKLADDTLPSMVRRIGDGEPVDIGTEMALLDYGSDEIGQVAEAFNTAQRTAVTAAVAEARTRGGISKVFLDIAHRSQLVVHRQLELLDVAEAKQGDPEHLDLLFQLDHLATRARRNAENLLILGGGQPGRRWRQPAALEDIVRSAISETEQFARVRTIRVPDVQVQGGVVGDLIHLLAELVDNATAFSPPAAEVTVRGNIVGKGVVVEVEDQGLGIEFDQRERLNETLRNPPGFQSMALSGQRHLGLFVVGQLAQRHGITVTLLASAYGGTRAIVLISSSALDTAAEHGGGLPAARQLGRHAPLLEAAVAAAGPAQESRATEHAPPFAVVRDAEHDASASAPWDKARAPVTGVARAGRAPLPHREPLANLAPGLRPDADAAPHSDTPARPRRSPEEARGSMSAFQRGTRLGRHSPGQGNQ